MNWFRAITQTHIIIDNTFEPEPKPKPETHTTSTIYSWFSSWNIDIETTLLELLFTYNKFCIQLQQRIHTMNNTYAAARYVTCCVESLSVLCGFVFRFLFFPETKHSREPDESWVNIVCLYRMQTDNTMQPPTTHEHFLDTNPNPDTPDAQYYIEETYRNYDHEDLGDEFNDPTYILPTEIAEMYYVQACNTASRILQNEQNIAEIVVWSKDVPRDEQLVKRWSSSDTSFPVFQKDILYSSVEFLHIDYRHPKLGEVGIELILPKQLMIVGNELFSPAFLYRWLKYFSNVPFVFDEAYCVYLMDDNVNQHILRYGDYIVLGKTDIEVVRKSVYTEPTTLEIDEETKDECPYNYEEDEPPQPEDDEPQQPEDDEPPQPEDDEPQQPEDDEPQQPEDDDYENVSNQL